MPEWPFLATPFVSRGPFRWLSSDGGFSPASLFANGEDGVWFKPGPDTCFQNSDGTTAASVGGPVGYIADLSGNGSHAIQANADDKPILRQTGGGLYYLEFDGVDDYMEFPFSSIGSGASSVLIAGCTRDSTNFSSMLTLGTSIGNYESRLHTGEIRMRVVGGSAVWPVSANSGTNHVLSFLVEGPTEGDSELYYDGAFSAQSSAGSNTLSTASGGVLGRDSAAYHGTINLFGIVAIDRLVTPAERVNVEAVLAAASGVAL